MNDDETYDGFDPDEDLEQCDSCGRMDLCEHIDGFGRVRVLCMECLDEIFQ